MDYEEISLKELIIILINGWKWIVGVTLATTLAAVIFTLGFKPVLYESNSSFTISIPASIQTQYGVYNFPTTNVNDYISLLTSESVLERVNEEFSGDYTNIDLKKAVSFSYDATKSVNTVNTKVTLGDSKLASELHRVWLTAFKETIEKGYQQIAYEQIKVNLTNSIVNLTNEQESIKIQLEALNIYKDSLNYVNGVSITESADYYLYYQAILRIMDLTLRDYEITATKQNYEQNLEAISALTSSDVDFNVMNGLITLPTEIIEPTTSIDRGLMLNTAIGFVLGGMLGVFIVFFLNYWKSEPKIRNL